MTKGRATPPWLWAAGAVFLLGIGAILLASVRRPAPAVFPLSALEPRDAPLRDAGPDTVTLDARGSEHWVLFDLERRAITTDPWAWDIGVKRHRLLVNGGDGFVGGAGVAALHGAPGAAFDGERVTFEASRVTPGGDSMNAVLDDWYSYDFFSHLLVPDEEKTFVLRTAEGNRVTLRILSYYCPGPEPGCMTMEYALP